MPKLHMSVSHDLSREEALERVQRFLTEAKIRFADNVSGLQETWNGCSGLFRFSVLGATVSATVIVRAGEVEISGTLPFAATLSRAKIERTIRHYAESLLA